MLSLIKIFKQKVEFLLGVNALKLRHDWPHSVNDLVIVLRKEEIGDFTRVEKVVDVLDKCLFNYLCVSHQQANKCSIDTRLEHQLLQEVSELLRAEILCDFDLLRCVAQHVTRQLCQALLSRAANSNQHHIASRLAENTSYPTDVRDSILEEDQVHFTCSCDVIVIEVLYEG